MVEMIRTWKNINLAGLLYFTTSTEKPKFGALRMIRSFKVKNAEYRLMKICDGI